jgi:hypothetical protein
MDKELQVVPQQLSPQAQPTPVSLTRQAMKTQIAMSNVLRQNVAIFSCPASGIPVMSGLLSTTASIFLYWVARDEVPSSRS